VSGACRRAVEFGFGSAAEKVTMGLAESNGSLLPA